MLLVRQGISCYWKEGKLVQQRYKLVVYKLTYYRASTWNFSELGSLQVSVRLPYAEYKHVPAIEVELIVIANLIIIPSDITIMAHDSFKYKIMQVSGSSVHRII